MGLGKFGWLVGREDGFQLDQGNLKRKDIMGEQDPWIF